MAEGQIKTEMDASIWIQRLFDEGILTLCTVCSVAPFEAGWCGDAFGYVTNICTVYTVVAKKYGHP